MAEQLAQPRTGFGVDVLQRAPIEDPGQRHLQGLRAQLGDRLCVDEVGADPADLAIDARGVGPIFARRLGNELGHREPLRRGPAELLRVVEGQAFELLLLADRAVQIEQHQPGLGMLRALAVIAGQRRQRLLAQLEVGIRERDHRLVEVRVVSDLVDLDRKWMGEVGRCRVERQRRQRRHARPHHDGGGCGPLASATALARCGVDDAPAVVEPTGDGRARLHRNRLRAGVVELGRAALRSGVAAVADHLLLDLVDLRLDAAVGLGAAVLQTGLGVVDARRAAECRELLARQAFAAHLAQHVEFALAHEIVAPLALDHGLEFTLGEVALARLIGGRTEFGPFRARIGHELDDLAEEAGRVFGVRHRAG